MKRALVAGTFDPVTFGHINIIERASKLFDEVFVVVASNKNKKSIFSIDDRVEMVEHAMELFHLPNVYVKLLDFGLLSEFAYENGINCIVRGIRNAPDFEYEIVLAQVNGKIRDIETVFIPASPDYLNISSSLCKTIVSEYGDISKYTTILAKHNLEKTICRNEYIGILKSDDVDKIKNRFKQSQFLPYIEHITNRDIIDELLNSDRPFAWKNRETLVDAGINFKNEDVDKFIESDLFKNPVTKSVFNQLTKESRKHILYKKILETSCTEQLLPEKKPINKLFLIELDDLSDESLDIVNNHIIIKSDQVSEIGIIENKIHRNHFGRIFNYGSSEQEELYKLAEAIHNHIINT